MIWWLALTLIAVRVNAQEPECLQKQNVASLFHFGSGGSVSIDEKNLRAVGQKAPGKPVQILDLATGHWSTIKANPTEHVFLFPSGDIGLLREDDLNLLIDPENKKILTLRIVDPVTGKSRQSQGNISFQDRLWSIAGPKKDGVVPVVGSNGEKNWYFTPIQRDGWIAIDGEQGSDPNMRYSPNEGIVQVGDPSIPGHLESYSLPPNEALLPVYVSKEKLVFYIGTGLVVFDRKTGSKANYPGLIANFDPGNPTEIFRPTTVAADEKNIIIITGHGKTGLLNIESGAIQEFSTYLSTAKITSAGELCGFSIALDSRARQLYTCLNSKSGEKTFEWPLATPPISARVVVANGSLFVGEVDKPILEKIIFSSLCPASYSITQPDLPCKMSDEEIDSSSLLPIVTAARCALPFQLELWPDRPKVNGAALTDESALTSLTKFAKPGGFQNASDWSDFLLLLKAGATKRFPAQVKAASLGVLLYSRSAYDSLLNQFPEIAAIPVAPSENCLTKEEKEAIVRGVLGYAEGRTLESPNGLIKRAQVVGGLIAQYQSGAEREQLADQWATKVVTEASTNPAVNFIFPDKIHVFAKNELGASFGLPRKVLTDITVSRNGDSLKTYLLASSPLLGDFTDTGLGIYLQEKAPIVIAGLPLGTSEQSISWELTGRKYLAKIEIERPVQARDVIPKGPSPDYSSLWKNNHLRGLVIVGANMENQLTDKTVNEYLAYYLREGFQFNRPEEVEDLPELLAERVKGKEQAQYFIKEAHADEDEQNLFELYKRAKVLRGTRKKDGRTEEIEIAYSLGEGETVKLPDKTFGDWLQRREQGGGGQFVFLNSSCWSVSKAIQEISSAYSPILLDIPATTTMDTFVEKKSNVMRVIVEGIRHQRTYGQMRQSMNDDPEYKSKSSNVFIFPDEDAYKTKILDKLGTPARVSPNVFQVDEKGVEIPYYSGEQ